MNFFESDTYLRVYDAVFDAYDRFMSFSLIKRCAIITGIVLILFGGIFLLLCKSPQERYLAAVYDTFDQEYVNSSLDVDTDIVTVKSGVKLKETRKITGGVEERSDGVCHLTGTFTADHDENTRKVLSLFTDGDMSVNGDLEIFINENNRYLRLNDQWIKEKNGGRDDRMLMYRICDIFDILPNPASFYLKDNGVLSLTQKGEDIFKKKMKDKFRDSDALFTDMDISLDMYFEKNGSFSGYDMVIEHLSTQDINDVKIEAAYRVNGISGKEVPVTIPNDAIVSKEGRDVLSIF